MNFGEVRKLTITALFSDDLLFEELVLKGGNALSLVHGISRRASLDLDFSLAKDFEDLQDVRSRMERTLADRFASVGFVPFDVKLVPRPSNQNDESVLSWGGYRLEFKLIDEKRHRLEDYLDKVERTSQKDSEWPYIAKKTVAKHLSPFFGQRKADRIDRRILEQYHDTKEREGCGGTSISRQLGILRSGFVLGRKNKKTNNTPDFSTTIIRRLERENARQGIITEEQYRCLVPLLPVHIKPLFVLCWKTGVRPSEAFRIRWSQVDFVKRLTALRAGETKTGLPRFLPMVKDVLKPSLLFYDARRSFRTYLPDEIAKSDGMAAMGHTQDTTFGRYHVEPQRAALRVLDALEKPEAKGLTVPEQLAQLHSLFQAGALTEQMYQAACANVLGLAQPSE